MSDIRIWVFDQIMASSVSGILDVLTTANHFLVRQSEAMQESRRFKWRVESLSGGPVTTASGQIISVDGAINMRSSPDAIIVAAPFIGQKAELTAQMKGLGGLLTGLRRQHERGAIVASYCTGSFLLAEAGLLDRRIATTHWAKAEIFRERYPNVDLRASEIVTEQDRIICSAAVTTSLNLALRLVEKFSGASTATAVARLLLIDVNRMPQDSYAVSIDITHADEMIAKAQRWMEKNLQEGFRLAVLADHLGVSERTLNRRFKAALGSAPLHYLQTLRIRVAKNLLETKRICIDDVSHRVGYGDVSAFRQLFKRETGISPREYERRFTMPSH